MTDPSPSVQRTRLICAGIAVAEMADVLWLRAPFLLILVLPFAVAAWRYRGGRMVSSVAVLLAGLGFAALSVNFAVANGLHAPAEVGRAPETINPGDFTAVYVGGALAVYLVVHLLRSMIQRDRRGVGATA